MSSIHVRKAGLLTTVQDRGRWGFQAMGVPVAGPMDGCAHRLANAMAGNPADAATLEVTLAGPDLEFEDERDVAVAGARFDVTLDGKAVATDARFVVPAGSRVQFGRRLSGARAYVAISGGIATPPAFGSRATHVPSAMGGLEGRPLKAGDRLPLGVPAVRRAGGRRPARIALEAIRPLPTGHATLRVLPGPQQDYFAADALDALQSSPYLITADSNRMGFRLDGPALTHVRGANIISDATPLGVLQVPASGQPILLMADRQTAGGYPKIATVITADIGVAGQLAPGESVSFVSCSPREALAALIAQERVLMAVEAE